MRKVSPFLLRISVSIILISLLFKFIDISKLISIIRSINLTLFFLSFLLFLSIHLLALYRWQILLKGAGLDLPLRRVAISYLVSLFFNLFLPSTLGGDFVRSMDLVTHTKRTKEVVVTVLLDRLSGYVGLVIVVIFAFSFGYKFIRQPSVVISIGILVILLFFILFLLFNQAVFAKLNRLFQRRGKISQILKDLQEEVFYFRSQPKILIKNLILSIFIQLTGPLICYILALALGINLSIIYFFIIIPIIGAISMLPVSIGGLGIRDLGSIYFFSKVGVSKDIAFAISFVIFFFIAIVGILGGIVYVLTFHSRWLQYHKKDTRILS